MIFRHCLNRLFEWYAAVALTLLGLHTLVWPHAVGASAFRLMLDFVPPQNLAAFFLMVGLLRGAALIANGQWPFIGPHLRALGALCGAVIWLQMTVALFLLIELQRTPPSPGIPVYFAMFVAELAATYRAAADVSHRRR